VDGAGFEPATSAMPTPKIKLENSVLRRFEQFLRINMRLAPSTVQHTVEDVRRFLENSKYVVSYETISDYLRSYLDSAPKTYNGQITSLRRFIKEFLNRPDLIASFKMAPVDEAGSSVELPSKKQLRKGFHALPDVRAKAIFLFTATTGLRKGEILSLTKDKVNFKLRAVIPNHFTRVKRSGITFYNEETEYWLTRYLQKRTDGDPRLFLISDRKWREIWRKATKAANVKITAQILRKWFATEMGELGVPDRFVDIFQGRAPRSVLAKHYTGKGLQRLKRIYDKAKLRILN